MKRRMDSTKDINHDDLDEDVEDQFETHRKASRHARVRLFLQYVVILRQSAIPASLILVRDADADALWRLCPKIT